MLLARPTRRWLRFSIRGLLLLMLLVAIGCGCLRVQVLRGQEQDRVVAELEELGVNVWAYKPNRLGRALWGVSPTADAWGTRLLGHGALREATHVSVNRDLNERQVADVVARLRSLRSLSFVEVFVIDSATLERRLAQALPGVSVEWGFYCGGTE